jgi:threonine/homoserine/homoserine lactone efflux protein
VRFATFGRLRRGRLPRAKALEAQRADALERVEPALARDPRQLEVGRRHPPVFQAYDPSVGRDLLAFAGVVAVIAVTPGPDMALVLRNGLAHGRGAAFQTSVGVITGMLAWAVAAALGIAALLHASAVAFTALKLAGAAYLVYLGARALLDAWRGTATYVPGDGRPRRSASSFRQGLLSNLLNPKMAVVFTSLIPQFVEPGDPAVARTLLLAAVLIGMGFVWLTAYAVFVARVGELLRRPAFRRALNVIVGVALTALGIRLALDRR